MTGAMEGTRRYTLFHEAARKRAPWLKSEVIMPLLSLLPVIWLGSGAALAFDGTPPCLDESAILGEAKAAFPSRYDRLMQIRESDPQRYARMLHNTAHVMDDPTMVAFQTRVDEAQARFDRLAASLAKATPAQRESLEIALLDAAESLVAARVAAKEARLTQLRDNARSLNAEIEALEAERDASVDELLEGAFQ